MKSVNCDWCACDFSKWIVLDCYSIEFYKEKLVETDYISKKIRLCRVCFEKFQALLSGELEVEE